MDVHKSGFVNIIGLPNTGKSTLLNSLVGEKISIITCKPQTTRHRILGIINEHNFQIIFSDTPGIITPVYPMQKIMMQYVKKSLEDADIILLMTEVGKLRNFPMFFNEIKKINVPIIILINKIDKIKMKYYNNILHDSVNYWKKLFPNSEILPISAIKKTNQDFLMKKIISLLSEHPPYYPKELFSNKSERFFVNEIIREKIFCLYKQEIPYSVEIDTILFKEKKNSIYISSYIYVERDSQKLILIGKNRNSLKKLKFLSIKSIELFLKKKIELEFYVKVSPKWRYNYKKLKFFGY
ncbi:GTPase Era [Blattabacterium cuenoti]|uniref:GTPase Era n=1 Tax=Blattabacterium cuenoti TaxID=1653831 RepID=UPI00163D26A2|nr:GTPase Era [Blattabacterium cuenoti]